MISKISQLSQFQESMEWEPCSVDEALAMLQAGTHELTIPSESSAGFASPKGEGETVDPNEVFLDLLETDHLTTPWGGGTHARNLGELAIGIGAAYVTTSRRATRAVQTSVMEGDLAPLPEAVGPTLVERFAARNDVTTTPARRPGERTAALPSAASAGRIVTSLPAEVLAGFEADLPAVPRLVDVTSSPENIHDRPVNPCGNCVFAGSLNELSQDNAVVTVLDGRACVRFVESVGGEQQVSGTATVKLPTSSRSWSNQDITKYAVRKVLDGTRGCAEGERGNVSLLKGWFGILGVDTGCSGLVVPASSRRQLIPRTGFTDIGNPTQ